MFKLQTKQVWINNIKVRFSRFMTRIKNMQFNIWSLMQKPNKQIVELPEFNAWRKETITRKNFAQLSIYFELYPYFKGLGSEPTK